MSKKLEDVLAQMAQAAEPVLHAMLAEIEEDDSDTSKPTN